MPAILRPRRVPSGCGNRLHALAARFVQDPSATANGLGVCVVETVTVDGDPMLGGHAEAASVACLPLRSVGSYVEILPRIEDARGHQYVLVPDSVAAIGFQFSRHPSVHHHQARRPDRASWSAYVHHWTSSANTRHILQASRDAPAAPHRSAAHKPPSAVRPGGQAQPRPARRGAPDRAQRRRRCDHLDALTEPTIRDIADKAPGAVPQGITERTAPRRRLVRRGCFLR